MSMPFIKLLLLSCGLFMSLALKNIPQIPDVTTNWIKLSAPGNSQKFTPRNAHASCVFKGRIWVLGGRTDAYMTFDLKTSYRANDIWSSEDGITWTQLTSLKGDFWAQNSDAKQPGPVAPWYGRYGHTLTAYDSDNDGMNDLMILTGGYSPTPSNDVWITDDGITWVYGGLAPWSPRAWHSATIFQQKLWIIGGTPLNNDVWCMTNITNLYTPPTPLTRSMKANTTYSMTWQQYTNAPWSPRAGFGLISQYYYDSTLNETSVQARERMIVIAGFGGYPSDNPLYDGTHGQQDIWATYDGITWIELNHNALFGPRGWFGYTLMRHTDPKYDMITSHGDVPPRVFLFGGGDLGTRTTSTKELYAIHGQMDGWWSRDMIHWYQINYEEGYGLNSNSINKPRGTPLYASRKVPTYSSQEWSKTVVDSETLYLGAWGMSVVSFNTSSQDEYPGILYLIGGLRTGKSGSRHNDIFQQDKGLFCDLDGVACHFRGICQDGYKGCKCNDGFAGEYCDTLTIVSAGFSIHNMSTFYIMIYSSTFLVTILSFYITIS